MLVDDIHVKLEALQRREVEDAVEVEEVFRVRREREMLRRRVVQQYNKMPDVGLPPRAQGGLDALDVAAEAEYPQAQKAALQPLQPVPLHYRRELRIDVALAHLEPDVVRHAFDAAHARGVELDESDAEAPQLGECLRQQVRVDRPARDPAQVMYSGQTGGGLLRDTRAVVPVVAFDDKRLERARGVLK